MAGHSHWSNIQRKKGKEDSKRAILFTRAAQQIILAAREGGGDPEHNVSLRIAIDYAKSVNVPKDNIERAIAKGTGTAEGIQLTKAIYEGFGPGNIPVMVLAITDNKNRTVNELRTIFTQNEGILGESGSVSWQFKEVGLIKVKPAKIQKGQKFGEADIEVPISIDEAIMEILESGTVDDIEEVKEDNQSVLYVSVPMNQLGQITNAIRSKNYVILSSAQYFSPNSPLILTEEKFESFLSFIEKVEENPDVQEVWYAAVAS
jgi:YebC/PmpR family DNA-binding regulatory protein